MDSSLFRYMQNRFRYISHSMCDGHVRRLLILLLLIVDPTWKQNENLFAYDGNEGRWHMVESSSLNTEIKRKCFEPKEMGWERVKKKKYKMQTNHFHRFNGVCVCLG